MTYIKGVKFICHVGRGTKKKSESPHEDMNIRLSDYRLNALPLSYMEPGGGRHSHIYVI